MEQFIQALPELSQRIFAGNQAKGFWPEPVAAKCKTQVMALIASEAYEAFEAERKGRIVADIAKYNRDLVHFGAAYMAGVFTDNVKDTAADELADVMVRCYDAIGGYGLDTGRIASYMENWTGSKNKPNTIAWYALFCGQMGYAQWQGQPFDVVIGVIMAETIHMAEHLGIPLMWHIEEKLNYNATRAHKHGKLF